MEKELYKSESDLKNAQLAFLKVICPWMFKIDENDFKRIYPYDANAYIRWAAAFNNKRKSDSAENLAEIKQPKTN